MKQLLAIIFTIISFSTIALFNEKNSLKNVISFKPTLLEAIKKNDSYYLDKDYIELVDKLKYLTSDLDCFQAFNYEPSIYYLINKKPTLVLLKH